jgi:hypothetical protein
MAFVRNAANAVFWVVMVQAVIGLGKLYGFAGLLAVILFAYQVFALICAEEFCNGCTPPGASRACSSRAWAADGAQGP